MGNILLVNYNFSLNEEVLRDLGRQVREYRLDQNLSSEELAERSGLSLRTVTGFERGEKNISLTSFIEILRALGLANNLSEMLPDIPVMSPIELMEREQDKPKRKRK